jgi:hypothetical protein
MPRKAPRRKAAAGPRQPSALEQSFLLQWRARFPELPPERELVLPAFRDWAAWMKESGRLARRPPPMRVDFAWPRALVALEMQGGTWSRRRSGHSSGSGIDRDCLKSWVAQEGGWILVQLTTTMLRDQELVWLPRLANLIRTRTPSP